MEQAVVALRNMGLMIETALTANLQAANRGDMVVRIPTELDDQDPLASSTIIANSVSLATLERRRQMGLSLVATLLSAYGASREKPLNVLRYE